MLQIIEQWQEGPGQDYYYLIKSNCLRDTIKPKTLATRADYRLTFNFSY